MGSAHARRASAHYKDRWSTAPGNRCRKHAPFEGSCDPCDSMERSHDARRLVFKPLVRPVRLVRLFATSSHDRISITEGRGQKGLKLQTGESRTSRTPFEKNKGFPPCDLKP